MLQFDEKTLANLEELCQLQCTAEEKEDIFRSLSRVLEYVTLLNEIDIQGVPTCNFVLRGMVKRELRKDEVENLMASVEFLSAVPDRVGNMVRVPPVLKSL